MKKKFKNGDKIFYLERNKISNGIIKGVVNTKIENIKTEKLEQIIAYIIEVNLVTNPLDLWEALDIILEEELFLSEIELKNNL